MSEAQRLLSHWLNTWDLAAWNGRKGRIWGSGRFPGVLNKEDVQSEWHTLWISLVHNIKLVWTRRKQRGLKHHLVQKLAHWTHSAHCTTLKREWDRSLSINGICGHCWEKCLVIGIVSQPCQWNTYVAKDQESTSGWDTQEEVEQRHTSKLKMRGLQHFAM